MIFSIEDNKVIKSNVDNKLPLSERDSKSLVQFFEQGTFNQKLDHEKNDSFLTLDKGGLELMQQRTLGHLYAMQEKINELKNSEEAVELLSHFNAKAQNFNEENLAKFNNDPDVSQVFESIQNDYELFEQNFSHFNEKSIENASTNPSDVDQNNNDFVDQVVNASKDILKDIDALSQKNNDNALVNRFDKVIKSMEEFHEDKQDVFINNEPTPKNENSYSFTPH